MNDYQNLIQQITTMFFAKCAVEGSPTIFRKKISQYCNCVYAVCVISFFFGAPLLVYWGVHHPDNHLFSFSIGVMMGSCAFLITMVVFILSPGLEEDRWWHKRLQLSDFEALNVDVLSGKEKHAVYLLISDPSGTWNNAIDEEYIQALVDKDRERQEKEMKFSELKGRLGFAIR